MQRTIRLLSLWNFLTDFSLFAPVAILYFAHVSGSYALGMSVFSMVFLTAALLQIPTGIFADRIGKKQTMLAGTIMGIVSTVLYAIGLSYWWLVAGAVFEGTARSLYSGNNDAYLHDILVDHDQGHEFHHFLGKVSSFFQIALAISALLGGFIAQWSFTLVVWINVIPPILKLVVTLFLPEPLKRPAHTTHMYRHLTEAIGLFVKNKELRMLSLTAMVSYALRESMYQFRAAFVNSLWPVWAIGISAMLSNVAAAFSFYFSGKVIARYKEYVSIVMSDIVSHVLNFFALLFPTVLSPILMASTSLVYGIESVSKDTLFQKHFTEHHRATMGSLNTLGGSVLLAVFSFGLGILSDQIKPINGLLVFQIFSLMPSIVFFVFLWRRKKGVV